MIKHPKAGMRVTLNDEGIERIRGLMSKSEIAANEAGVLIADAEPGDPEKTFYIVSLCDPLPYLVDNFCIDEVKKDHCYGR